jgi:thiamine-phosphate diphosphorylase
MPDASPPDRAHNAQRGAPTPLRFAGRSIPRPVLCLVTSGALGADDDDGNVAAANLVALATRASAAGIDIIQIREPRLPDDALLAVARRIAGAVDRSRTAVLVNDRTDVAMAAAADGVHLRASAMSAARVRALAPGGFLIGRSVHSVEEARAVDAEGAADYLIFGTVFPSASKPAEHQVAGVDALRRVCSVVRLPVLAIGGMTENRAGEVAAAGAAGIAAIGMFADRRTPQTERRQHQDPRALAALVRRLRRTFDTRQDVV